MITKNEIIERIGKERRIEKMATNIAHASGLSADLEDLAQIVYEALLDYSEETIRDLWEKDQINFFIARIIMNQYRSDYSPFYRFIRKYQARAQDLEGVDVEVEQIRARDPEALKHRAKPCENKIVQEFRDIEEEFAFDPDIMSQDRPEVRRLKFIIDNKIGQVDRTIILLYAEYQSLRKLGKALGVSHSSIRTEVQRIRRKVLNELQKTE